MKLKIDYFLARRSDNKIIELRHLILDENDIIAWAMTRAKEDEDSTYKITNIHISETTIN